MIVGGRGLVALYRRANQQRPIGSALKAGRSLDTPVSEVIPSEGPAPCLLYSFSLHSTTRHNLDAMTLSSPPCFSVLVHCIQQDHNPHVSYLQASGCLACITVTMMFPRPPPLLTVLCHHRTPCFSPSPGHIAKDQKSRSNDVRKKSPE